MRRLPIFLLFCPSLLFAQTPITTQTTTSIVSQAIAAFSPTPVSQVQLSGTANAYAGSSQPIGTFTATLKSTGESTLQLNLPDLSRTETVGTFGDPNGCSWSGADAVVNSVPIHNCLRALDWILPVLSLQSHASVLSLQIPAAATGVQLQVAQAAPQQGSAQAKTLMQKESMVVLTLDANTNLPSQLSFNVHPDDDAARDIPILIRYSDYRQQSGTTIPFHIQKYINNNLVLDITVESANLQ